MIKNRKFFFLKEHVEKPNQVYKQSIILTKGMEIRWGIDVYGPREGFKRLEFALKSVDFISFAF